MKAMNEHARKIAEDVTRGSNDNTLTVPQVLEKLADVGIEGYFCDLRHATKTYYMPDGDNLIVNEDAAKTPIAERFDAVRVSAAVRQSQRNEHTYRDFCRKIAEAGCAGYIVTLLGRRAVYFGRDGEVYTEHFPGGK
jgi:uncharacterized protein YbcV (DUF1398 family)